MAIDFNTDAGKVRALIGDTDETLLFLSDDELAVILTLNTELYLAVADALEVMATKMTIIQQKIKTLDLQTDGPAVAKVLMDRAKEIRSRIESPVTAGDDFELIDVVNGPMELWMSGYMI
jgi:hypothetical protein